MQIASEFLMESEKIRKQRNLNTMIRMNTCPICKSKLNRGKKNKKNGYRRTWTCTKCESEYTI